MAAPRTNFRDPTAIDAALEKLNTAWGAASQEMYAAGNDQANPMEGAGFDGGNSNPNQDQPTDGDVSDVPYEEVK